MICVDVTGHHMWVTTAVYLKAIGKLETLVNQVQKNAAEVEGRVAMISSARIFDMASTGGDNSRLDAKVRS